MILNDGSGTRICQNRVLSPLDLKVVSPTLGDNSRWSVLPDDFGSDHFPTLTISIQLFPPNRLISHIVGDIDVADWSTFSVLCSASFTVYLYDEHTEKFGLKFGGMKKAQEAVHANKNAQQS